ncbi:MAG: hypothetical protein GC179_22265 [Anaerolineaceae bacterium]|nr:hypothetical protein [Anaerolineaceae bacterium]
MLIKKIGLFLFVLLTVLPAAAQDNQDTVTVTDISYGDVVQDTITNGAFYDWWHIQALEGDVMVVDMGGSDGLAPLIGIIDSSGSLVARSADGEPNQSVSMDYTIPKDGQYTIVATRVGNQSGTTTGHYALRVRKANPPNQNTNSDQYEPVTFPCHDFEATTAVSLRFGEEPRPNLKYRITVYGMDGFVPVIRLQFDIPGQKPFDQCNTDANSTLNDTFTVPGEDTRTITKENLASNSQLIFTGAENAGTVTVTIASKNGAAGRYFAVIDGFTIDSPQKTDLYDIRMGPLAKFTPLTVYMAAGENSRIDPYIKWASGNMECDDAGRGDCKTVPTFSKAGVSLHESEGLTIVGGRSDAGLVLAPGNSDIMTLEIGSRNNETYGNYVLVLLGQLPVSK